MTDWVRLTWTEVARGAWTGVYRHIKARQRRREQTYGMSTLNQWGMDIEAAIAELAFAKWCGVYWPGATDPDSDVGDVAGYGVRSTSRDDGCLLLHDADPDARRFVLMVGDTRDWRVAGVLEAGQGKCAQHWRADDPSRNVRAAYFVPQGALEPCERSAA